MSELRVPDLNTIAIAGRLVRDAELKYISNGNPVCSLTIVNTRYFKDKNGERKEDATFIDVKLWGAAAEWTAKLRKGRAVIVEGRIKSDSWEDKTTGQKRTKLEINAQRVQPLDWEQAQATETTTTTEADYGDSEIAF